MYRKNQDTSKKAAAVFEKSGKGTIHRAVVLRCIEDNPSSTWAEIAELTGISGVWKRISELRAKGKIKACGKKGLCTLYRVGYDAKYIDGKESDFGSMKQIN